MNDVIRVEVTDRSGPGAPEPRPAGSDAGGPAAGTVLVRPETGYGYARASYEVNLGCNYDCEHCYLGEKMFAGMDWPGRERLLQVMADAGVLWLQLTGGEPLRHAGPACRWSPSTGRLRHRPRFSASTEGSETAATRPRKEVKRS